MVRRQQTSAYGCCGVLTWRSGGGEAVHAYASRSGRADCHCKEASTLTHRLSKSGQPFRPAPVSLLTHFRASDRRWDSDFLTLSHLLHSHALGRLTEFETHFDRHSPVVKPGRQWKTHELGGSVVYDLGTHLMDQVVVLFGMPKRITAFVGTQREGRSASDEDSCTVLLHYEGMLATVKAAVVSPETGQLRFWVRGEEGSWKKVTNNPASRLVTSTFGLHATVPPGRPRRPTQNWQATRRSGVRSGSGR